MRHEDVLHRLRQDPEYVAAEAELAPLLAIADAVLRLRLAKGWSQSELARRVGTRQANISKLENGLANPTVDFLRRVAQALETELTVQLGSEHPAQPAPQIAAQSTPAVYVIQEIRTIKPETLWGSRRTSESTLHWAGFAPAPDPFTRPEHYEAA